jgi:hypothetical protein
MGVFLHYMYKLKASLGKSADDLEELISPWLPAICLDVKYHFAVVSKKCSKLQGEQYNAILTPNTYIRDTGTG